MGTKLSNYEWAREKYRPDHIRTLFIAEAPPGNTERFFYFEDVRSHDSLFWEMTKVLCGVTELERPRKREYLQQFKTLGCFLIDSCEAPLKNEVGKKKQIRNSTGYLITRAKDLCEADTMVILICATVYDVCLAPLKEAGLNVINTGMIPHPAFGHSKEFREKLSRLLK